MHTASQEVSWNKPAGEPQRNRLAGTCPGGGVLHPLGTNIAFSATQATKHAEWAKESDADVTTWPVVPMGPEASLCKSLLSYLILVPLLSHLLSLLYFPLPSLSLSLSLSFFFFFFFFFFFHIFFSSFFFSLFFHFHFFFFSSFLFVLVFGHVCRLLLALMGQVPTPKRNLLGEGQASKHSLTEAHNVSLEQVMRANDTSEGLHTSKPLQVEKEKSQIERWS